MRHGRNDKNSDGFHEPFRIPPSMTAGTLVEMGRQLPVMLLTAFIALAPGGMDQMGILAREAHADLAVVTSYQMFRIFFILLVVPPVLKKWFAARWFRSIERWVMPSASIQKKGL
ncbi:AbrB family transcriptional regulator [Geobacillus stearothermophilus]|nr:AbrB family transcriptional regulator [Geobacillus stearothermophilus]WJQ05049.1 AbrB family transcriptional regulator [Geobacillus stearothermophilus]